MTKIYTVYDSKIQAYMTPFFLRNKGEALRAWEESVNDEKSQFYKYPADFTLFEIGEYDTQTGTISTYEAKLNLGLAQDFKKEGMIFRSPDPKDNIPYIHQKNN